MNLRQAAQQALEALEESVDLVRHTYEGDWRHGMPTRKAQLDGMKKGLELHEAAITALRAALAEPEQEPLTDDQIALISVECAATHKHDDFDFARAIEKAHGIGDGNGS